MFLENSGKLELDSSVSPYIVFSPHVNNPHRLSIMFVSVCNRDFTIGEAKPLVLKALFFLQREKKRERIKLQ